MKIKDALEDIVLDKYPQYDKKMRVVNNTIRLDLAFKTRPYALDFVKLLSNSLRKRIGNEGFIIFYKYICGCIVINDRAIFDKATRAKFEEVIGHQRSCDDRRTNIII